VPVNVAVEEPRAGVVCEEPNRDIITGIADAHDVADDRIFIIVRVITSTADYKEIMAMYVNWMLLKSGHAYPTW
jgi:hypothetical protein